MRCDHDILNITRVIRKFISHFYPLLPSIRCVFKFHCTFEKGISMMGPPFQPVFWQHQGWHTKRLDGLWNLSWFHACGLGWSKKMAFEIKWYLSGVPYSWQCKKGPCRGIGLGTGSCVCHRFSSIREMTSSMPFFLPLIWLAPPYLFQAKLSRPLTLKPWFSLAHCCSTFLPPGSGVEKSWCCPSSDSVDLWKGSCERLNKNKHFQPSAGEHYKTTWLCHFRWDLNSDSSIAPWKIKDC